MEICCCLCGAVGYEELLAGCIKCKSTYIHVYCMKRVVFIVPDDWVCEDCDETPYIDEATVPVSQSLQSEGKNHLASPEKPCNGVEISKKRPENSKNTARLETLRPRGKRHLSSPEKLCNGVEVSKPRVENSKHMDRLATLQPREEKLSNRTLAGQKRRKKRHALASETISNPSVSTQVTLHDPEHIKRYNNLKGRKIYNTRYLDDEMLDSLGLREDIEWMVEQVGWTQFLTMKEPTYISLTHEFLSTVKVEIHPCGTRGLITFRLQNQDHQLTIEQFSDIFGFPNGGNRGKPKGYHDDEFWSEISDEPHYDPSIASATAIYNPCFRVMQRFMAQTLFGRGFHRSVVRRHELLHLWAMVKQNRHLDTGMYLAQHLQRVGKAAKGTTVEIVIGGLITSIARYFNINMEGLAQATGSNKIDLHMCQTMQMIVWDDGQYKLKLNNLWPLPDPAKTTIRIRENWKSVFKEDGRDEKSPSQDSM